MQKQLIQVAALMRLIGKPVWWSPVENISKQDVNQLFVENHGHLIAWEDSFEWHRNGTITVRRDKALATLTARLYQILVEANLLGLGTLLPPAFQHLHDSNVGRLWTTEEKEFAEKTKTNLKFTLVPEFGRENAKRVWCCENLLGHVIPPPSYVMPDYAGMIDELDGQELLNFDQVHSIVYGDAPEFYPEDFMDLFGEEK
jgi:hypothetical protein